MVEIMSIGPAEAEELREMEREYQKNPDLIFEESVRCQIHITCRGG
jgi:hypothetical protein